ncbi:hypothetical protein AO364_1067 [Moraxella catarrhalis]|nr:hypothetical protein AO364_1067 [Moraxella catarrhalis]
MFGHCFPHFSLCANSQVRLAQNYHVIINLLYHKIAKPPD